MTCTFGGGVYFVSFVEIKKRKVQLSDMQIAVNQFGREIPVKSSVTYCDKALLTYVCPTYVQYVWTDWC